MFHEAAKGEEFMRHLALALLILVCPLSTGWGEEKEPAAAKETGVVKVEVQGKLVRKGNHYCVQAKDPDFDKAFLVELLRTEDKNRPLDERLSDLEGQVVVVRGVLRFISGRQDGPELGIHIKNESQVQKTPKQ